MSEGNGWHDEHRRRRVVKNELAFRAHNERRRELELEVTDVDTEEPVPFVCECGQPDCVQPIALSVEDWERVHAHPNRFVIRRGHEFPRYERVVDEVGDYFVVEKRKPVD
jgi:hypothetical protein